MHFSAAFGLGYSHAGLDFVDINLLRDTPLFLDPYAIQIRQDLWSAKCGDHIRSFFTTLLDALRAGNMARAEHLLNHLREPNETFLGVTKGPPDGRGVGRHKASQLAQTLVNSRAFATGLLSDIAEAELFIHGVGRDTISDLTTNILRGVLADYTMEQCSLHGIGTAATNTLGPVWDITLRDWVARPLMLPHYQHKPILLIPKFSVRYKMSIDSQEFYNHHMVNYLKEEYTVPGGSLVQTFRDGSLYVTKKKVKERHPFIKDDLASFVRDHPEVLRAYKDLVGAKGPLTPKDLDEEFDEVAFAGALQAEYANIPPGNEHASAFHRLTMCAFTFLFYPDLIDPIKENEIHEGRKRIDIKFDNAAAGGGFFDAMCKANQTRALNVFVECKNYSKSMNNPELDQLAGRFGHQRGRFGFVVCRTMENRNRIIAGCRDTAADNRGFIIVLEDADMRELLDCVRRRQRSGIDEILRRRFGEIIG